MEPELSVIIVSWNVRDLLRECLRSLYDSIQDLSCEVFVVDNASTDGSVDVVQTEFPDVKVVANRENVGFGRANNQAWQQCRGRYILFLNPDTFVPTGSVEEMVRFVECHPRVGMVGPELPNGDGKLLFNWSRISFRGIAEFVAEKIASLWNRTRPLVLFARPRSVRWLTGACWLVRRCVIEQAGPFDPVLFLYGEEPDFCYRVRKAGWEIWFLRHVQIVHYKGQSIKQVSRALPLFLPSISYVIAKTARDRWREIHSCKD